MSNFNYYKATVQDISGAEHEVFLPDAPIEAMLGGGGAIDKTLSMPDIAADAKAVGDAISPLSESINEISDVLIGLNLPLNDGYYDSTGNVVAPSTTSQEKYTDRFLVSNDCNIFAEINLPSAKSGWWAVVYWDIDGKFLKRENLTFAYGTHAEANIIPITNSKYASITFRSYGEAEFSLKASNGNVSQNIIKVDANSQKAIQKVDELNNEIQKLGIKDKEYLKDVIGDIDVSYSMRGIGTLNYNDGLMFNFKPSSDYTNWWFYNNYDSKYGFVDISDGTKAIVVNASPLFETTVQIKIRGYNVDHSQYKEVVKNIYSYDNRKIIIKWSDIVGTLTTEYPYIWILGLNCTTWKESDFGKDVVVNVGIYDLNAINVDKPIKSKEFHIVAHRGVESDAPENTIIAFQKAYDKGYRYLETDIQYTSEGIPVLFHDETIDAKSNGTGTIASHTLAELKALDFGSWKSPEFTGTKICTLDEFLVFCKKKNCFPYLEIKNSYPPTFTIQQAKTVADMVDAYGMSEDVTWIGFSYQGLKLLRQCNPIYRLGIIKTGATSATILSELDSLVNGVNNVYVDVSLADLTEQMCKAISEKGYDIETWTLLNENGADEFVKYLTGFTLSN